MIGTTQPHPDRWLVVPGAAFDALVPASDRSDLLALRLASGHVEPADPPQLAARTRTLLAEGWAHVRVLLAGTPGPWRADAERVLVELADALTPADRNRVRLHDQAAEPEAIDATLRAPDEAVLAHWLRQGRPAVPELLAPPAAAAGWLDRYRQAFAAWRDEVEAAWGPEAFDSLYGAPEATAVVARVGFHVLAANDRVFQRAAGARAMRGDAAAPQAAVFLGHWTDQVQGIEVTVEAFGSAAAGADVTLLVHTPDEAAARTLALRALDVLGRDGAVLAGAPLNWDGRSARATLANADDRVLRSIRRGESAVRLHGDQATP